MNSTGVILLLKQRHCPPINHRIVKLQILTKGHSSCTMSPELRYLLNLGRIGQTSE